MIMTLNVTEPGGKEGTSLLSFIEITVQICPEKLLCSSIVIYVASCGELPVAPLHVYETNESFIVYFTTCMYVAVLTENKQIKIGT